MTGSSMAPSSKVLRGGNVHHAGQDKGHHADIFGVAAARGFEARGDAGALVGGALGVGVMPAGMAVQARDMMVQGHAVAGFERVRARADRDDGAGGFMAEDARRGDGAVVDFLDVRGADAADGDAHEQLVAADARHRHGLQAQVIGAAIDDGPHGFGKVKHKPA